MTTRILAALLSLGVVVAGLAVAQGPADKDEPPLRLKKKPKKPAGPAEADPAKPDAKKPDPARPPEEAGKKKDAEDDVPEVDPEQEVDEQEVLNRVAKNMRAVEEKLANLELNDGTRQTQDDILKDIDSLIRKAQSPSGGGADQNQNQQDQQDQQDKQNQAEKDQPGKTGQAQPKSQPGGGKKAGRRQRGAWKQVRGKGRQGRGQRGGRNQMARGNPKPGQKPGTQGNGAGSGAQKPNKNPGNGKNPGGGGNTAGAGPDRTADLYKNVWGHLPESLRAEMNAYSNPRPFLPRYDELIKRYYRTIAEQGRRKGD